MIYYLSVSTPHIFSRFLSVFYLTGRYYKSFAINICGCSHVNDCCNGSHQSYETVIVNDDLDTFYIQNYDDTLIEVNNNNVVEDVVENVVEDNKLLLIN